MLRRPLTVLTITAEDVADYEDRRERQLEEEAGMSSCLGTSSRCHNASSPPPTTGGPHLGVRSRERRARSGRAEQALGRPWPQSVTTLPLPPPPVHRH